LAVKQFFSVSISGERREKKRGSSVWAVSQSGCAEQEKGEPAVRHWKGARVRSPKIRKGKKAYCTGSFRGREEEKGVGVNCKASRNCAYRLASRPVRKKKKRGKPAIILSLSAQVAGKKGRRETSVGFRSLRGNPA